MIRVCLENLEKGVHNVVDKKGNIGLIRITDKSAFLQFDEIKSENNSTFTLPIIDLRKNSANFPELFYLDNI